MSYQYIEVRYPTGKYIGETGHTNGKVFWDNIFFQNDSLKDLTKDECKEVAKHRLHRLLEIYKKQIEYIECPTCRQQFEEPQWDFWFIDGNHDLCPSCLDEFGKKSIEDQNKFREEYRGIQI